MLIAVRDKIYNSHEEPISLHLSADDKKNIQNMAEEASSITIYPGSMNETEVEIWLDNVLSSFIDNK